MSREPARLLAWSSFALFLGMNAYSYWHFLRGSTGNDEWFSLFAVGFALVGALVASRHPANPVGWMLLAVPVVLSVTSVAQTYATVSAHPGRAWVAWFATWSWHVWMELISVFLPLVFPTGHLVSSRWRPVAWLGALALALGVVGTALRPGDLGLGTPMDNPVGVAGADAWLAVVSALADVLVATASLLAAVSLVVRFRRSTGLERLQLKWFVLAGLALVGAVTLAMVGVLLPGESTQLIGAVGWFSFLAVVIIGIPASMALAILRHRLLDIDVVINRTLVYGSLTALLGSGYLGSVLVLRQVLDPLTDGSDWAVAGSTLAVAALFRPARHRIQQVVDRRFYRRRYDTRRTVEAFSARLRSELDLQAVGENLREVVEDTVEPSTLRLWLREAP